MNDSYGLEALINVLERKGIVNRGEVLDEIARLRDAMPDMTCPYCGETIKQDANICPHCGRDMPQRRHDPDPYVLRG